jgi:hypothetical protein
MQPVNDNRLQHQVNPARLSVPGQRDASAVPVKTPPNRNLLTLPEDVVQLSTDRSANLDAVFNKKPSVPVSTVERKALRDSFSVYA